MSGYMRKDPWILRSKHSSSTNLAGAKEWKNWSLEGQILPPKGPQFGSKHSCAPGRSWTWKPRQRFRKNRMKRVPCAPRNTTSFIMRAGKMGITAPLVSPVTPLLQTPAISPAPWPQESLGDGQSKNEFKVNAYGSMKGCIRLRTNVEGFTNDTAITNTNTEDFSPVGQAPGASYSGSSSDVQCKAPPATSVQQLEERLDHGLQRFEILYNNLSPKTMGHQEEQMLCVKMEDQEGHIAYLEEENMSLQQQLMRMQQEVVELRRQLGARNGLDACSEESMGDGSCAS